MKLNFAFFSKNITSVLLVLILILAFFLRFYNFENRWGLAYDQAHDALVAKYAVDNGLLPLVGPFSSAGPFQTGGIWYWLIMIGIIAYPFSFIGPWILMIFLSLLCVYLLYIAGNLIGGKKLGIIASLLGAVSQSQVMQSTNLTNQSPLSFYSLLTIIFAILFLKTKRLHYIFLVGFFTSCALTTHFQGVLLLLFAFYVVVFSKSFKIKILFMAALGFIIPLFSIIIFDFQNEFVNSKGFLQYYLVDQYKISYELLERRWLTYIFQFWPKMWAYIIGGNTYIAYFILVYSLFLAGYLIVKKKNSQVWIILSVSLVSIVAAIRYVRTPIFESYLMFLNPFVLLVTAGVLMFIYRKNSIFGIICILLVASGSLYKDFLAIPYETNRTAVEMNVWRKSLIQKYPGKKFAVYDREFRTNNRSVPLALYLYEKELIDDNGVKIGVGYATSSARLRKVKIIHEVEKNVEIYNLSTSSAEELKKEKWALVNPRIIYISTEEWYNNKK